jgi:hypothetical protein
VPRKPKSRPQSDGYRAGIGRSLVTAFPISDCGTFEGLLKAIDKADPPRR